MKKYYFAICGWILACGCNYEMQVETPDFNVSTQNPTVRAGEPVVFEFEGKADYITFYSGELYSDYEYRNGRFVTPGWENLLSFDTEITEGTQADQLSILISDSFNGDYSNYENIIRTDWTDITSWFSLASGKEATSSSSQDISAFVSPDRPTYIAFRYRTRLQTEHGSAARWVVSNLKLTNRAENPGDVVLFDLINAGFRVIDPFSRTDAACRSSISQTQMVLQGNFYGTDNDGIMQGTDIENEHWIISRGLDLTSPRDMGPDRPLSVKSFTQPDPISYTHIYETPGNYHAVFVASCQSIEEKKEVVKEVYITVNE